MLAGFSVKIAKLRPNRAGRVALRRLDGRRPNLITLLTQFIQNLNAELLIMLTPTQKPEDRCKKFGHVIDRKKYGSGVPRCAECKAQITALSQLRG